ncbi:MAG: hypothetical protein M3261_02940 [Thermoproteota archaeon]|nr:hypothetical protein [Thermoproteota archaeon]
MATISRKEQEKKREKQQQASKGYWQNELDSLGIAPDQKKVINEDQELENLAHIIKQAMFQDYKIAYSHKGDSQKEEAESTVAVG